MMAQHSAEFHLNTDLSHIWKCYQSILLQIPAKLDQEQDTEHWTNDLFIFNGPGQQIY